jgi:guanylate kinase
MMKPISHYLESCPLVVVVSGPSGVGKDYVLSRLKSQDFPAAFIITNTTRPMRAAETDGVDYHFISPAEFKDLVARNEMLEHASVYGHGYGVPKQPVKEALALGKDVIIKVDVQGARTIKKKIPQAIMIFLSPPSMEELAERLNRRHTESSSDLKKRLSTAAREMAELPRFDYVIVNYTGQIDKVVGDIQAIIAAEKLRVKLRKCRL